MEIARSEDFKVTRSNDVGVFSVSKFMEDIVGVHVEIFNSYLDEDFNWETIEIERVGEVAAWAYNLGLEQGAKNGSGS